MAASRVAACDDELAQHGVVVRRDLQPALDGVVEAQRGACVQPSGATANALAAGAAKCSTRPVCGVKSLVLGAQAHLDGVALKPHLVLRQRQRLAARHAQLPLHQVQPGERLGHRMLDLQPGVHLHQEEISSSPSSRNSTVPAPT